MDELPTPSSPAIWTIADVRRETGLGQDTLRVWERRYGFPRPDRDAAGERVYPAEQVQQLRRIKQLLDAGFRPGKVVALPPQELDALLRPSTSPGPSPSPGPAGAVDAPPAGREASELPLQTWLPWLREGQTDHLRQALQQQILKHGLGHTVQEVVAPMCVQVGQAWMQGELTIYQEHLFTETLQNVLQEAMAAVDASGRALQSRPRVLMTTTPAEQHRLGLLMAECFFALECCERLVLGVSTPIAEIVAAVVQLRIDVLALSFSALVPRREVMDSVRHLQAQLPPGVEIWLGGAGSTSIRRFLPEGVQILHKAGDVAACVKAWRQRQP